MKFQEITLYAFSSTIASAASMILATRVIERDTGALYHLSHFVFFMSLCNAIVALFMFLNAR